MKKIEIKIPDNLSPEKEAILIAKKLIQKSISGSAKEETRLIGSGVTIEHTQTQITITKESKEPVITMVKCNICGSEYQNNTAHYFWHNYGGNQRKVGVCSKDCQKSAVNFFGIRAAISKNKLKPFIQYR